VTWFVLNSNDKVNPEESLTV